MRIVGGTLGGRRIAPPHGDVTRPTTDRVREALMSALAARMGADLGGEAVLDAFAGSGALGLEALSRGAGPVTFVEHHRRALDALGRNVESLGVRSQVAVVRGDVFSLANAGALTGPFSLILLDPPYTLDAARIRGLLTTLAADGAVAPGAVVTWEHASDDEVAFPEGFESVTRKRYGTTAIDIAVFGGGSPAS